MKKHLLMAGLLALLIASCKKQVDKTNQPEVAQYNEMDTTAVHLMTTAAATLDVFPVRGSHNTGYDKSLDGGSRTSWNCNRGYSNILISGLPKEHRLQLLLAARLHWLAGQITQAIKRSM